MNNPVDIEIDTDYQVVFKLFERYYPKKKNYSDEEVREALEKKLQNKFADIK